MISLALENFVNFQRVTLSYSGLLKVEAGIHGIKGCKLTEFKGTAIGRTEFGYGCVHIRIQAQKLTAEGDLIPVQTFDDQRIDVLAPPTKAWPEAKKSVIKLGDLVCDTLTGTYSALRILQGA